MNKKEMDTKLEITIQQANQLASYLGQRPYIEVAQLISLLQSLRTKEENDSAATALKAHKVDELAKKPKNGAGKKTTEAPLKAV